MGTLKSNVIEPATGTNLTLGASGDAIDVVGDALQLNTWKDSGGNTLFTSDGSGTLSSVNAGFGSAWTLLSTGNASDSASLDFTLSGSYTEYYFQIIKILNIFWVVVTGFQKNCLLIKVLIIEF